MSVGAMCGKSQDISSGIMGLGKFRYQFGSRIAWRKFLECGWGVNGVCWRNVTDRRDFPQNL